MDIQQDAVGSVPSGKLNSASNGFRFRELEGAVKGPLLQESFTNFTVRRAVLNHQYPFGVVSFHRDWRRQFNCQVREIHNGRLIGLTPMTWHLTYPLARGHVDG